MSDQASRRRGADRIHYEDIETGKTVEFGRTRVTREDIIQYAQAFDPQPFHLDEAAARQSMIGQLCASGWHSCAILMRLLCDGLLLDSTSVGSPGIDEVKWLKPVLPGNELTGRYTCNSKRPLASRPGVGLCKMTFELVKSSGEVAMVWESNQMFLLRREAPAKEAAP